MTNKRILKRVKNYLTELDSKKIMDSDIAEEIELSVTAIRTMRRAEELSFKLIGKVAMSCVSMNISVGLFLHEDQSSETMSDFERNRKGMS